MNIPDRPPAYTAERAVCMGGYAVTCLICAVYIVINGSLLHVNYADSWIYVNLAKWVHFRHTLQMNPVYDLIYPPLYPALISLAYFFKTQTAIFRAIMTLNVLVYSSAFIPLYLLLRNYSQLTKVQAFLGAIFSLSGLWTLGYVTYVAGEPLYFALAVWVTWMLIDGVYLRSTAGLLAFGCVLAAMPLTKAIGNLVFPAFVLYSAAIYFLSPRPRPVKLIVRPLLVLLVSAVVFYAGPRGVDAAQGYLGYLSHPSISKLSYWLARTRLNLSWLLRGTKTALLPLLLAVSLRNWKLVYKDPLVIFAALIFAGTFVVVPLFTPADPLFWEHPRYYIPFVFVFFAILMKYRSLIDRRDILVAAGLLAAGIFIGFTSVSAGGDVRWQVGAYYLLCFAWLLYGQKRFANTFLTLMAASILLFVWSGRMRPIEDDGYVGSFFDRSGIIQKVVEVRQAFPETVVMVDHSWPRHNGHNDAIWTEYRMLMIYMPFLPVFADLSKPLGKVSDPGIISLLLTDQSVKNAVKLVQGKHVALYQLKN